MSPPLLTNDAPSVGAAVGVGRWGGRVPDIQVFVASSALLRDAYVVDIEYVVACPFCLIVRNLANYFPSLLQNFP